MCYLILVWVLYAWDDLLKYLSGLVLGELQGYMKSLNSLTLSFLAMRSNSSPPAAYSRTMKISLYVSINSNSLIVCGLLNRRRILSSRFTFSKTPYCLIFLLFKILMATLWPVCSWKASVGLQVLAQSFYESGFGLKGRRGMNRELSKATLKLILRKFQQQYGLLSLETPPHPETFRLESPGNLSTFPPPLKGAPPSFKYGYLLLTFPKVPIPKLLENLYYPMRISLIDII